MITHCTRFGGTGADVTMQVSCGGQSRRIRIDILNRDMFDPHAGTPEHTSWTMALLGRLDRALGSNIMERPAFTLSGESRQLSPKPQSSPMLEDLEKGTFDALFDRGSYRPSELYRQARNPPPEPSVELVSSSPSRPRSYTLPNILPLLSRNPLIQTAVAASLSDWTFPTEAIGEDVRVTTQFNMNCVSVQR